MEYAVSLMLFIILLLPAFAGTDAGHGEYRQICLLIVLGPFFYLVPRWIRRRSRAPWSHPVRKGCCASCGYDLTGNVSGICPECGLDLKPTRSTEELERLRLETWQAISQEEKESATSKESTPP